MPKKASQRSLDNWTGEKWGTKSGKPSLKTGERYLPKAAREALTDEEYARTSRKKRKGMRAGKQVRVSANHESFHTLRTYARRCR